jgi:hypothetical protein
VVEHLEPVLGLQTNQFVGQTDADMQVDGLRDLLFRGWLLRSTTASLLWGASGSSRARATGTTGSTATGARGTRSTRVAGSLRAGHVEVSLTMNLIV